MNLLLLCAAAAACAIAFRFVPGLWPRHGRNPGPKELRRRFDEALQKQFEFEAGCGYDQKIGMAAIGELSEAVRSVPVCGSSAQYAGAVLAAATKAQENCALDGEYSSGKASIGSGICRLRSAVPEEILRKI